MNIYPVILAAGRGSRLQLVHQPKALIPIKNKSLIFHTLETLQKLGLPTIHIVIGYLGKVIQTRVNAMYTNISYIQQEFLNGTGGALLQVFKQSDLKDDDALLVLNGDDSWLYTESDLRAMISKAESDKLVVMVTPGNQEEYSYYRKVILDEQGKFAEFSDEPTRGEYLVCGCYLATRKVYEKLLSQVRPNITGEIGLADILSFVDAKDVEVCVIPTEHWHGINTLQELEKAQAKIILDK